jgi:hypothetical protein
VVQLVDRLEAEDERRIAVRLEDDGGEECRLETVGASLADDAAEAAQRGAAAGLLVVGQLVQVALNGGRCSQACDQPTLAR